MINKQVDWVCAKNKFFAQIIHPKNFPASMRIVCNRMIKRTHINSCWYRCFFEKFAGK